MSRLLERAKAWERHFYLERCGSCRYAQPGISKINQTNKQTHLVLSRWLRVPSPYPSERAIVCSSVSRNSCLANFREYLSMGVRQWQEKHMLNSADSPVKLRLRGTLKIGDCPHHLSSSCGMSPFNVPRKLFFERTFFFGALVSERKRYFHGGGITVIGRGQEVRGDASGNPKTASRHVPAGGAKQQRRHLQLLDRRYPVLISVVPGVSKHGEEGAQASAVVYGQGEGVQRLVSRRPFYPPGGTGI